jgi:hypothetical protein
MLYGVMNRTCPLDALEQHLSPSAAHRSIGDLRRRAPDEAPSSGNNRPSRGTCR